MREEDLQKKKEDRMRVIRSGGEKRERGIGEKES